jgi:mRNA-degrading endonuclease RelE of RelBE toxin-antitoxin system
MYTVIYSPKAQEDLRKLKKSEPAAFQKAVRLLNEVAGSG